MRHQAGQISRQHHRICNVIPLEVQVHSVNRPILTIQQTMGQAQFIACSKADDRIIVKEALWTGLESATLGENGAIKN